MMRGEGPLRYNQSVGDLQRYAAMRPTFVWASPWEIARRFQGQFVERMARACSQIWQSGGPCKEAAALDCDSA